MNETFTAISNFGIAVVALVALAIFAKLLITRILDENKEREKESREMIKENTAALSKVADTLHETNSLNEQLSETNEKLVTKFGDKLDTMQNGINTLLERTGNIKN